LNDTGKRIGKPDAWYKKLPQRVTFHSQLK